MTVETAEYVLDRRTFMRAAIRTYWRRLWPVSLISLVGAAAALFPLNMLPLAVLEVMIAAGYPFYVAYIRVNKAMSSPLNALPYVCRFADDTFEQLSGGERRAFMRYNEWDHVDRIPEGIRITMHSKIWFIIPAESFKTPEDVDAVCTLLIAAGKMKPPK